MGEQEPTDLLPLEKAAERLGVSRATMWRRVKELRVSVYANPFNRRQRLLSWAEVHAAARPKKIGGLSNQAADEAPNRDTGGSDRL